MTNGRDLADDVVGRFREALDRGEAVDPEQVIRLHPEIADDLRARFAALRLLDRAYESAKSEPEAPPVAAARIGGRVGAYRLLRELGAGGMGTVYLARLEEDTERLERGAEVALKIVHPHLPSRPGFVDRFRREAEAGRRVRHENVVPTYDMDTATIEDRSIPFLAMEYVEGRTLREMLEDLGVVPEALMREIARQVADGLASIHAAGIVHRDLKPENVLITDDHEVRIMDLGVARLMEESQGITTGGQFAGSVLYAAPEQFQGSLVGAAADLYALGVLLYEFVSGEHPFRRDTTMAVIRAHVDHRPPPLGERNPDTSPFLSEVVACLLAKDPQERFGSAARLRDILAEGERGAWWSERERELTRRERRLPHLPVRRETRLFGRETDLARLHRVWEGVRVGRGRTVLVVGEPGIGKTRLLAAFLDSLEREDVTVLYGQYAPAGGPGALSEAIERRFGTAGLEDAIRPYLETRPSLVAPFADAVRHASLPDGRPPLPQDAACTALIELARGLSRERPLVWIVDDLHFATTASRRLVLALARALEGHRILLLISGTPQIEQEDLAHLARLETCDRMDLGRLSPRDVVELLQDAFRSEALAERLGGKVAYKSDGVPFFVFEMIRALKEDRIIEPQEDGSFTLSRVVDGIEVPSVVRDLVDARLGELSKGERAILDVGAVGGFEFDADLVARVLGRKRVGVLQDLAEIERRSGLVRGSARSYQFDHHLIQEVVYEDLNPALRSEYHTLLAESRVRRDGTENVSGELAAFLARHHLYGTGPEEAAPWLRAALDYLLSTYDHESAVEVAQQAADTPGLLEGEARIHVLERAMAGLEVLGRWEEERRANEEAVRLADQAGDPGRRAALRSRLGGLLLRHLLHSEARDAYEEARRIATADGDRTQEGRAACGLGSVLGTIGNHREARRHHEHAAGLARAVDDRLGEWRAVHGLGWAARGLGLLEEAEAHLRRALELSHAVGDKRDIAQSASSLANTLKLQGRYEEAMELHEQALQICREVGHRLVEGYATGNIGNILVRLGRFDEALRCHQRALAISREAGDQRGEIAGRANLGNVLLHLDRLDEARAHFEHHFRLSREADHRSGEGFALGRLGDIHIKLGRPQEALEEFERSLAVTRELGDRHAESVAIGNMGRSLLDLGRYVEALARMEAALAIAREVGDRQGEAACQGDLGMLHLVLGRAEEARVRLDACRTMARDIGDQRGEAFAEDGLGRVALLEERPADAVGHFRSARAIARDIGGRRREALATLGLGRAYEALGRKEDALRDYETVRRVGVEIAVAALEALGAAHLAALGAGSAAEALRVYEQHAERLDVAERANAAWLLWKGTGDRRRLAEAWATLESMARQAPEDDRERFFDGVPLYRDIRAAWLRRAE